MQIAKRQCYWQASGENGQTLQQTAEDRGMSFGSENKSTLFSYLTTIKNKHFQFVEEKN